MQRQTHIALEIQIATVVWCIIGPLIAKLQFGTAAYKQDLGIEVSERQMYDLAFESNLIKLLVQEMLK